MATTFPSAVRLTIVVAARNLATDTLRSVSSQVAALRSVAASTALTIRNLGMAWTGFSVTVGAGILGLARTFSDFEMAVVSAMKRASEYDIEAMFGGWEQAVSQAKEAIKDAAKVTGVSAEEIAKALEEMVARGASAFEMLTGTIADGTSNIEYLAKAAMALDTPMDKLAGVVIQIQKIYEATDQYTLMLQQRFAEAGIAVEGFRQVFNYSLQDILDMLNYVSNNMAVTMDDLIQVFQHAGGTIISTGTSLEEALAITATMVQKGFAPGRIGRFLRATTVDMDMFGKKIEEIFEIVAYGLGISEDQVKLWQKEWRTQIEQTHKSYMIHLKERLEALQTEKNYYESLLLSQRKMQKLIEGTDPLASVYFTKEELERIRGNADEAAKIVEQKYKNTLQEITVAQEEYNAAQEEMKIGVWEAMASGAEFLSKIIEEQTGIHWEIDEALLRQMMTADGILERWKAFQQIIDSLPPELGEVGEAIKRMILEAAFGERWQDAAVVMLASLDEIEQKMMEIASESAGSVEREWERVMGTLEGQWSKLKENVKMGIIDVIDAVKPEIEDIIERIGSMLTAPEFKEGLLELVRGFIDGLNQALDILERIMGFFEKYPGIGRAVGKMAGLGLVVGPLMMFIGAFAGMVNNIITLISKMGGILSIGGAAGGAAAASKLAALAPAGQTTLAPFLEGATTAAAGAGAAAAKGFIQSFSSAIWGAIGLLLSPFTKLFGLIKGAFLGIENILAERLAASLFSWAGVVSKTGGLISSAIAGIKGAFSGLVGIVKAVIAPLTILISLVTFLAGFIYGLAEGVYRLGEAFGGWGNILSSVAGWINANLMPILKGLWDIFKKILEIIFKVGEIVGLALVAAIKKMIDKWNQFVDEHPKVKEAIDAIARAFGWLKDKILKVIDAISGWLDKVIGFLDEIISKLKETIGLTTEEVEEARRERLEETGLPAVRGGAEVAEAAAMQQEVNVTINVENAHDLDEEELAREVRRQLERNITR